MTRCRGFLAVLAVAVASVGMTKSPREVRSHCRKPSKLRRRFHRPQATIRAFVLVSSTCTPRALSDWRMSLKTSCTPLGSEIVNKVVDGPPCSGIS
jgi:hypothetical protein